jgi:hypothetical protein
MFNIGDIFYSSWGYDQTNVSFYQVVEKRGKTTAILREVAQEMAEAVSGMSGRVVAVKDKFLNNETHRKRFTNGRFKMSSCERAYPWDGEACYVSWYH